MDDTGTAKSEQASADRRVFKLGDRKWKSFQAALDRPVRHKSALKRLLSESGLLD